MSKDKGWEVQLGGTLEGENDILEEENALKCGIDIADIHTIFEDKGSNAYDLTSDDIPLIAPSLKDDPNYDNYLKELREEGIDFNEDSVEFKSIFLLHKHFEETPKEELDKEFKAVEDMGLGGPTVEEYFQGINPVYQYAKGYSEGATKLKEEIFKEIESYHDDSLESSTFKLPDQLSKKQVIEIINKIYNEK